MHNGMCKDPPQTIAINTRGLRPMNVVSGAIMLVVDAVIA